MNVLWLHRVGEQRHAPLRHTEAQLQPVPSYSLSPAQFDRPSPEKDPFICNHIGSEAATEGGFPSLDDTDNLVKACGAFALMPSKGEEKKIKINRREG